MPDNRVESVQEYLDLGYKAYYGEEIVVLFRKSYCEHLAFCVRGSHEVFNLKQRPWVNADALDKDSIIEIVNKCTSGALKYYIGDDTHELKLHRRRK